MVVFGGHMHRGEGIFVYYNDVHILNLESLRWSPKKCANAPPPRYGHTATVYGDAMYVFGLRIDSNVSKNRDVMRSKAQFASRRGSVDNYVTKRVAGWNASHRACRF